MQSVRDKSDPIEGAKAYLAEMGVGEEELKTLEKEIRRIVNDAADFAEASPEPELSEVYTDVLVEQY